MKMGTKALINYYARLIQKESYDIDNVPSHLKELVQEALDKLPPIETEDDTSFK